MEPDKTEGWLELVKPIVGAILAPVAGWLFSTILPRKRKASSDQVEQASLGLLTDARSDKAVAEAELAAMTKSDYAGWAKYRYARHRWHNTQQMVTSMFLERNLQPPDWQTIDPIPDDNDMPGIGPHGECC